MPKMQQALIGVGVMLIDNSQRVLLGKRIKNGETITWCFPGGKVDQHESFEVAAARELFEETHLKIEPSQFQAFMMMSDLERAYLNLTVGAVVHFDHQKEILEQSIQVTEPEIFECWQWFAMHELPENLFPETQTMLNYWLKKPNQTRFKIYPISSL